MSELFLEEIAHLAALQCAVRVAVHVVAHALAGHSPGRDVCLRTSRDVRAHQGAASVTVVQCLLLYRQRCKS